MLNRNKEFILDLMKYVSDRLDEIFKELDHNDCINMETPLIFFKENSQNKYKCFDPKYFEMYNISFNTSVDGIKEYLTIDTVNQRSDYYTAYMVYLSDDNTVFYDEHSVGTDQKQIDAMKDIIEFFRKICQHKWESEKMIEKAVAAGYMDKNGFLRRDDIDVDIF